VQLGKRGRRFEQKKSCLEYADVFRTCFGGCFASLFQSDGTWSAMRLPIVVGSQSIQKRYCTWTAERSPFASRWKKHVAGAVNNGIFLQADDAFFCRVREHVRHTYHQTFDSVTYGAFDADSETRRGFDWGNVMMTGVDGARGRRPARGKGLAAPHLVTCQLGVLWRSYVRRGFWNYLGLRSLRSIRT